jgi:SAM-dependent methyltransferase
MVARLRAKPEGAGIPVTMGNFADVGVDEQFDLIYIVFNTFYALLAQEEQIRCFANVATHLKPGGHFLIEAFVPDLGRFDREQRVSVVNLGSERVQLDASQHDFAKQLVRSRHILISEEGIRLFPVQLRYVWPSEMDLMARLAGLIGRALGRLAARAVHLCQRQPCISLRAANGWCLAGAPAGTPDAAERAASVRMACTGVS